MDIQSVNNSTINSFQNAELSSVAKLNVTQDIEEINKNAIDISIQNTPNTNQSSDLANNVGVQIKNISNIASVTASINSQMQTIDTIQSKVQTISSGTSTQMQVQPQVATLISNYNTGNTTVNEKIAKMEDLNGDSHAYFDGQAGAIPLNIDMLDNATATRRSQLAATLEQVNELNESYKQQAQKVITEEVIKVQEQTPLKAINFGKESSDFTASNVNNLSGSVVSSQSNASQMQTIKLLS